MVHPNHRPLPFLYEIVLLPLKGGSHFNVIRISMGFPKMGTLVSASKKRNPKSPYTHFIRRGNLLKNAPPCTLTTS